MRTRPTNGQRTAPTRHQNSELYKCVLCQRLHALRFCKKFLKMSVKKREEVVERHRMCTNCLAKSHDLRGCNSVDTCRKCERFHHTLLHPKPEGSRKQRKTKAKPRQRQQPSSQPPSSQPPPSQQVNSTTNAKILMEAIRSLANVLCSGGDQHVA